jgi:hypothetical protein
VLWCGADDCAHRTIDPVVRKPSLLKEERASTRVLVPTGCSPGGSEGSYRLLEERKTCLAQQKRMRGLDSLLEAAETDDKAIPAHAREQHVLTALDSAIARMIWAPARALLS